MKVEQSQVTKLEITDVKNHDPIRVYLENDNQGHGRLTITEWGGSLDCILVCNVRFVN